MNKAVNRLIHITVPLFIIQLIAEMSSKSYGNDFFTGYISEYINLTPQITFLLIQIILLAFLGILLLLILLKKRIPSLLILLLNIIMLFQFTHTYEVFSNGTYSYEAVISTIIGIIGVTFLFLSLRKNKW